MAVSSRDDLAALYLDQLPFKPYPLQEEAILTWFTSSEGVLICAPTGTGKTLIAEAALFEALHLGKVAYYTTPLISLTEQKFREIQQQAVRWGFQADQVGLVTGNRKINPRANVIVAVAEILLNRLLQPESFEGEHVASVVMDEFHSFSDPERGIVWEFALSLLPKTVRMMLLSATVGNAYPFVSWLDKCHGRRIELVEGTERRVPLSYRWVPDMLLNDHLETMALGDDESRRTPALVFCFNRDECWNVAEQLKGKSLLADGQQKRLAAAIDRHDWTRGAGPKLKPLLYRGVGVHHAGLLPTYKRIVEDLFVQRLLTICVCTETLAAGINLPARSVVLPSLMKGPYGQQKLIDPSSAHQMFGRAGRPQFDTRGYVDVLAHEDDVKILRWKEKYDQIPEDTKDPMLIRAKKAMKKKQPTRNPERQYWNEQQFEKLKTSPPGDLVSRGPLPWRMLAYLLLASPDVPRIRWLLKRRLMDTKGLEEQERQLDQMLLTLHAGDFVELEPEPPSRTAQQEGSESATAETAPAPVSWLSQQLQKAMDDQRKSQGKPAAATTAQPARYQAMVARPTARLHQLFLFRSVNPVYGMFLLDHLAIAEPAERLQLFESVLELPGSLLKHVRVPPPNRMPPGRLAIERIDPLIIERGILPAGDLYPEFDPSLPPEERKYAPPLAEKVYLVFQSEYPGVHSNLVKPAWAAGDLLNFGGDFFKYVSGRDLAKQEGLIFRHLLRLILLIDEFRMVTPASVDPETWNRELKELRDQLTESCRAVDPHSTENTLAQSEINQSQGAQESLDSLAAGSDQVEDDFGAGL